MLWVEDDEHRWLLLVGARQALLQAAEALIKEPLLGSMRVPPCPRWPRWKALVQLSDKERAVIDQAAAVVRKTAGWAVPLPELLRAGIWLRFRNRRDLGLRLRWEQKE